MKRHRGNGTWRHVGAALRVAAVAVLWAACSPNSVEEIPEVDSGTAPMAGRAGSGGAGKTGSSGSGGAGMTGGGAGMPGSGVDAGGVDASIDAGATKDAPAMETGSPVDAGADVAAKTDAAPDAGAAMDAAVDGPMYRGADAAEMDAGAATDATPDANPLLIGFDDFEDCNIMLPERDGRAGYWFTYLDNFGSTLMPRAALAALGGAPDSPTCSMHYTAGVVLDVSQSQYGYAGVGITVASGSRYDASRFAGIRFMAKGVGRPVITFVTPNTNPISSGGFCTGICGDHFGAIADDPLVGGDEDSLTNVWTQYEVRWHKVHQSGWGTASTFDASKIETIQFNFPSGATIDLWFDQIEFIP